ncbi:hypothetical protein CCACVL1_13240 [Corchorus capsularis]|uniref:DUF4220 domain-containing protein n=1 Tax=Corchorus capsularis TaxID=210143 RepID=A0A1R3IBK9_COCAP|nr:hypothetical protein CCACVL1_13240 [Corchorus capsularis]
MLFSIAIALIYVEIKNSVLRKFLSNVISEFWNEWELRATVVFSILLQYLLFYSGNKRRKYRGRWLPLVEITAWSTYLLADWMATLVLSNLLRGESIHKTNELVLWTAFILWQLGGPYNITAYTAEDNELWLRYIFAMLVQVGEAIFICVKFRSPIMSLNFVAAPIFIAGVLRYAERVWALRSASQKYLRNSLTSKKDTRDEAKIVRTGRVDYVIAREYLSGNGVIPQVTFLREAHLSSIIHQPLFSHLPFRVAQKFHEEMVFTKGKPADEAFRLVGTELHFFYDLLYTKIPINVSHHQLSFGLRIFSFLSAASALVALSLIYKRRLAAFEFDIRKTDYSDIAVTYLLLFGAIGLEVHAFYVDAMAMAWTRIKLPIPQSWIKSRLHKRRAKRRIKTMGHHDLIDCFIKLRTSKLARVISSFPYGKYSLMFWYSQWKPIDHDLKEFIYSHLKEKRGKCEANNFDLQFVTSLLDEFKGGQVFKRMCEEKQLHNIDIDDWKMDTTDLTCCVLLWHIATTLVYYDDVDNHRVGMGGRYFRIGKSLSNYMMYLVVARPLMLPLGYSEAAYRDTCKEADFFFSKEMRTSVRSARKKFTSSLLHLYTHHQFLYLRDEEDYSELSKGRRVAKKLQELVRVEHWDHQEKWEFISLVWMEMMTYAASHCSWKEHGHALRRGGELLTLVSLLMAHFGLSTQIRKGEHAKDEEKLPVFDPPFHF